MMQIGCYELHIYCDSENHVPGSNNLGQFTGKDLNEALRNARQRGWKTGISGDICPVCKLKNPSPKKGA